MIINYIKENSNTPFPQANDIYKILKFVHNSHTTTNKERFMNIELEVVPRQVSYYRAAAQYLGLISKNHPTELSRVIFNLDNNYLFVTVVNLILRHKVFGMYYQNRNSSLVENYLINFHRLNQTTAFRRMSTVKKWVEWCDIIIKENSIKVKFLEKSI